MRRRKYFLLLVGFGLIGFATYFTATHSSTMTVVRQVERTGGYVAFSHYGPDWLVKLLGNAYPCKSVREVGMGYQTSDGDLSVVASLKQARIVMLNATDVRGPGLARLKDMPKLEDLDLTKSAITDEGLKYLNGLQTIKRLSLARTKITDQGVSHLQQVNNLKELNLEDTKVTDVSFQYLSRLPLKWLNVRRTLVTTNGTASFQKRNPTVHISQ